MDERIKAHMALVDGLIEAIEYEFSGAPERDAIEASARQLAEQGAPRNSDDVDLLLRAVFELCEATEEAPEVEPRNEHQRGFDKGRRFEAKAIRRAVGDWFQATFCGQSFMGDPVLTKPNLPHCVDGACSVCAARPLTASPTAPSTEASEPVRDERADLIAQAGEEMSFEAWFKTMCPVDGINAKIAARAAWQAARALKGTPL